MKRIKIAELLADKKMLGEFCKSMQNGAVAVVPTDTLYGFAVAADQPEAVERVYRIKNRSAQKPLILFVSCMEEIKRLGFNLSKSVTDCLCMFWPGALTAVLPAPKQKALGAFTFATIGVRIPEHQELLSLLERLPFKLLTTSANRSGNPSDEDPNKIACEFASEIDWLIDGGTLEEALPSTVADFSVVPPKILRQGKVII